MLSLTKCIRWFTQTIFDCMGKITFWGEDAPGLIEHALIVSMCISMVIIFLKKKIKIMTFPVLRIFVDFFTIGANRILHSWKYGAPFYFSPFLPSLSAKFLITQLCLGEFKTEKKKHGARITLLYSTHAGSNRFPVVNFVIAQEILQD